MSSPLTLEGFLTAHKSNGSGDITHTKIGNTQLGIYGGAYSIPQEKFDEFYNLYCKEVIQGGKDAYLTEAQMPEGGPIVVDIDERYSTSIGERQHSEDHILDLIGLYTEKIVEMIDLGSHEEFELPVYVMEKDDINKTTDCTKDGIHIIFGIQATHACQMVLRQKIIAEINDIFEDLPLTNSYEQLVDIGIARGKTNWQLFGSKKPGYDVYKLTHIYNMTLTEDMEPEFNTTPIPNIVTKEMAMKLSVIFY